MARKVAYDAFMNLLTQALIDEKGVIVCVDYARRLLRDGEPKEPGVTRAAVCLQVAHSLDPGFVIPRDTVFAKDFGSLRRNLTEARPHVVLVDEAGMIFAKPLKPGLMPLIDANRHVLLLSVSSIWSLPEALRDRADFRLRIEDPSGKTSVHESAHAARLRLLSTKSSIGRQLARTRKDLEDLLKDSDRANIIPISLGVMSGLSNLAGRLGAFIEDKGRPLPAVAFEEYVDEWQHDAEAVALGSWIHSREPGTPPESVPAVGFILIKGSSEDMHEFLSVKSSLGQLDDASDLAAVHPFNVGPWIGALAMVIHGVKGTPIERHIENFVELRAKMADLRRVARALSADHSPGMTLDEAGLHHPVVDSSDDERMRGRLLAQPRYPGGFLAHRWATELPDLAELASRLQPPKGPVDQALLQRQNSAIKSGFLRQPRFEETFRREWGIVFPHFCDVLDGIARVAYKQPSDVAILRPSQFVTECSRVTGLPDAKVQEVIRTIDEKMGSSMSRPLIPLSESRSVTSYEWAVRFKMVVIESVFFGTYDSNLRGKAFELSSRKALTGLGFSVLPEGHVIRFPTDLLEELKTRFGIRKTKTDIDLLGCRDRVLLFGECKEFKPRAGHRLSASQRRALLEDEQEIALVGEYASRSRAHLERIIDPETARSLGIPSEGRVLILPLLVANMIPSGFEVSVCGALTHEQMPMLNQLTEDLRRVGDKGPDGTSPNSVEIQDVGAFRFFILR